MHLLLSFALSFPPKSLNSFGSGGGRPSFCIDNRCRPGGNLFAQRPNGTVVVVSGERSGSEIPTVLCTTHHPRIYMHMIRRLNALPAHGSTPHTSCCAVRLLLFLWVRNTLAAAPRVCPSLHIQTASFVARLQSLPLLICLRSLHILVSICNFRTYIFRSRYTATY